MSAEQSGKPHSNNSSSGTMGPPSTEAKLKPKPSQPGTARLTSIAPRPSMDAPAVQKPVKSIAKSQRRQKNKVKREPSGAAAPTSTRIPSAAAKAAATSATGGMSKGSSSIPSVAIGGMSTAPPAGAALSAAAAVATAGNTEQGSFSFDTEDNLIQELLAGIPSTAWLPTDPLTSEGWFTDPRSSVITQDSVFSNSDFQFTNADSQVAAAEKTQPLTKGKQPRAPAAAAAAAKGPHVPQAETYSSTVAAGAIGTSNEPLPGQPALRASASTLVANSTGGISGASSTQQASAITPDSRLIAALRSKKDSRPQNRSNGSHKKTNPLVGFAKKHGVGYPVGNQMMAYLSPALLSSSPPNAKQLRTNPYKYYSPPKPAHRAGAPTSVKGRNLMLGTSIPPSSSAKTASAAVRKPTAMARPAAAAAAAADSSSKTVPKTSNTASKARASAKGVKWEIAQDKQLLRGVREQRWANGGIPRDPSKFSALDWDTIARGVASAGIERTTRQCRRRWAVMHAHLGSAIMDFVDSTLTPQSSAQSTPNRGKESAALSHIAGKVTNESASNISNPKLANLPMSSPPFIPAFARLRESDTSDHNSTAALSSPHLNSDQGHHIAVVQRSPKQITLDSVDMSQRWQSPAYCQLLADVVQAMSDPQSQAADVVRKYTTPAHQSKAVSDKDNISFSISLPEVSLSAVASVVMSESILATSETDLPTFHSVLPTSINGVTITEDVDTAHKFNIGNSNPSLGFSAAPDPAVAPMSLTTADLDIGVADPDWNMYNQFLQSLGSAQVDLGGDWANIFGDSSAGIGIAQGVSESTSHFANASVSSGLPVSTADFMGMTTAQHGGTGLSAAEFSESRVGVACSSGIDDDDATDDDFVLDDLEEEGDDEEDDDDDEIEVDADADAEDADDAEDDGDDDDDDNDGGESNVENKSAILSSTTKHHTAKSSIPAHAASDSNADSEIAWGLTLDQLGLGLGTSSVLDHVSASGLGLEAADVAMIGNHVSGSGGSTSNAIFAPDPLIQQLLRGAASIGNSNMNNAGISSSTSTSANANASASASASARGKKNSGGKDTFPIAAQSAWLSSTLDSAMLPQWDSGDSPSVVPSQETPGPTKTPSSKNSCNSSKKAAPSTGTASKTVGKTPRQGGRVSGQLPSGTVAESGFAQRQSSHPAQLQQLLLGDIGTPSRRNSLKSARKRLKKKSASASIAKALSAAAMIDMDVLISTDSNIMDTEMTGLYQDALQEGEELDVQEESLIADNSEYLFTSDQMRELRDQQIQNFQIVTQSLLVSCTEVGPHAQRTRHWKQQLDQLALWHLLGTRESPSDLVSSEGLCHFATLIDSAEKMYEQSGSTGMTELGRFAPNPTSFFAIPGITAVIPDLYEAIDEIHRATQLSAAEPETRIFSSNANANANANSNASSNASSNAKENASTDADADVDAIVNVNVNVNVNDDDDDDDNGKSEADMRSSESKASAVSDDVAEIPPVPDSDSTLSSSAATSSATSAGAATSSATSAGAATSPGSGSGSSTGSGVASCKLPEVRAFNSSMDFTTKCQCTPANGFKSAMVVQCVFPLLYLQMRNGTTDGSYGKRKLSEVIEAADGRLYPSAVGGLSGNSNSNSNKQLAVAPKFEDPVLAVNSASDGSNSSSSLLQPAGVKPLKPLVKPISRQLSGPMLKSRDASCSNGLPAIMPLISMDNLPSYTTGDVRSVIDEMRSQVRAFKRDLHRVARSRRRIFVQGDDGVPRLEWMQVKIEPLTLPLAMQCLLVPLIEHSGFRESMMPKIVVVRKPKNRIHFLDTEDTLLLKGLRLFGLEDVASIRVHLMPCKTASQLRNRINNLRARRAEANPIKDFCLRRIMPFTLEEEEVLRLGVIVYGDEFNELNQNFLVNRPILALSHVWSHMRNSETAG